MRAAALVLLLQSGVAAAQPDGGEPFAPRGPGEISLTAEQVIHRDKEKLTVAEGHATLRTDDSAMTADQIAYDGERQLATGVGHVAVRLLRGGLVAAVAEVATVKLDHNQVSEVFLQGGSAYRKKGLDQNAFLALDTPEALVAAGQTTFLLTANHLTRSGDDWALENADLVPCECDWAHPSWGIRSSHASIDPRSERATLVNATVRVHDVPVLWVPWINLPLTDHQTGLLAPKPSFTQLDGFSLEQPVFIALGRSADLTFTPGYFFGADRVLTPVVGVDGGTTQQLQQPAFGVRGPRLISEARWAPVAGMFGRLQVGLLYDLNPLRDPVTLQLYDGVTTVPNADRTRRVLPKKIRGLRYEAAFQHRQQLAPDWYARVDGSLLSDGYYFRDITADVLARESNYQRSTAAVYRRTADSWLGFDVVLRQDLNWGYPVFGPPAERPLDPASPARGPSTLQRLPAFSLFVPERRVAGPVTFSLTGGYTRLAPAFGVTGDEGTVANEGRPFALIDGQPVPLTPSCQQYWLYSPGPYYGGCPTAGPPSGKTGQGDGIWQPGEREARDRLDLFPRLAASLGLGDVARVTPYLGWRQDVWFGEASSTLNQRGYALLGARVDAELARTFAGSLRHIVAPGLELRGVPLAVGSQPAPYDELDTSLPSVSRQLQLVAELRQRLLLKTGGATVEVGRLDLWQGFDLADPKGARVGETMAQLSTRYRFASLAALARADLPNQRFTRLSARAALDDGRGDQVYGGYESIAFEGTDRTRLPLDLLVGEAPPLLSVGNAQSVVFGARVRLKGFGLRYDALVLDQQFATTPLGAPVPGPLTTPGPTFSQHGVGVSYGPACDCWRLEVSAVQRAQPTGPNGKPGPYYGVPDFGATLTIQNFGSFGVAR